MVSKNVLGTGDNQKNSCDYIYLNSIEKIVIYCLICQVYFF